MTAKFEMGSIANIVNSANKKERKNKKKQAKLEQSQDAPIDAEIKEEVVENKLTTKSDNIPNASGKKRKIEDATEDVSEEVKSPKKNKNKKKGQRTKPKKASNDTAKSPEKENSDENKKNDDKTNQEKMARTVFIGNLPANVSVKNLKKTLTQYGTVANIRVRGVVPARINLSKKAAFLSKQINPNKNTVNAYVVFHLVDSVQKALALNGTEFEGNVIQVDKVLENQNYQNSPSVFLGNLSYKCTDNELREFFKDCGAISNVRLIRDSKTGIGKGFGYVSFEDKDGVVLALQKNGQTFNGRELRVKTYSYNQEAVKVNKEKKIKSNNFEKKSKNVPASPTKKVKLENDEKPKKKDSPTTDKTQFKGEQASKKKFAKKINEGTY